MKKYAFFAISIVILSLNSCDKSLFVDSSEDFISNDEIVCTFRAGTPSERSDTKVAISGDEASQPIVVKWKGSTLEFQDGFALVGHEDGDLWKVAAKRILSETTDELNGTFEASVSSSYTYYTMYPFKDCDGYFLTGADDDNDNWVYSMSGQTGYFADLSDYMFMTGNRVTVVDDAINEVSFNHEVAIIRLSNLIVPDLAGKTISGITISSNAIASASAYRGSFFLSSRTNSTTEITTTGNFNVGSDGVISDNIYVAFFPTNNDIEYFNVTLTSGGKFYSYEYDGSLCKFEKGKVYTLKNKTMHTMADPSFAWYTSPASEDIYEISSAEDLYGMALLSIGDSEALSFAGESEAVTFAGKTVKIKDGISEIDLSTVCGSTRSWTPINGFSGTFDGNNCSIINLSIYSQVTSSNPVGLFGTINSATIKNVSVSGKFETSSKGWDCFIGGLVGETSGSYEQPSIISNCMTNVCVYNTTNGSTEIGGICGFNNYSYIIGCQSTGEISASYSSLYNVDAGGIVGHSSERYSAGYGIIGCCHNTGTIQVSSFVDDFYNCAGGIIGLYSGQFCKIVSCYNTSSVKAIIPGAIIGASTYSQHADVTASYYISGFGFGRIRYGSAYDYGTTKVTSKQDAVDDMNNSINTWNGENPAYICNKHYALSGDDIVLLDGVPE